MATFIALTLRLALRDWDRKYTKLGSESDDEKVVVIKFLAIHCFFFNSSIVVKELCGKLDSNACIYIQYKINFFYGFK